MASLADFWPPDTHCDECLNVEAESSSEPVFLAVHQPMRLLRQPYPVATATAEPKTEDDLLKALLLKNPPSGTLVIPITGASGVGKSHMIRWLDVRLRARSDHARRHVVRVPKSASLKFTLGLILKGLPGEKYGRLAQQLNSAQLPPTVDEATWLLHGRMMHALEEAASAVSARIAAGEQTRTNHEQHSYYQGAQQLLLDPALRPYFTDRDGPTPGALARIAARCIQGDAHGGRNEFLEEDFDFLQNLDTSLLASPTRRFLAAFRNQGAAGIQRLLASLNTVVDAAASALVRFNGVTLSELLVEVRRTLLTDDLELVLLVEDFAALAGVQGSFLDAIVRHGIEDGERVLCVMRTALAVTEGYLSNKETVMTRAQAEWRIQHRPFESEDEAVDSFTDFVGGYLNAARWGEQQLRLDLAAVPDDEKQTGRWLRDYLKAHEGELDEAARARLDAFGRSPRGAYPLFPFNREAVRQLAREYLRTGEAYIFEPRLLIRRLLRDTLIGSRQDFLDGVFPPAGMHGFNEGRLDLDVRSEINARSGAERERIGTLVYFWGGNPRSLDAAAGIDPEVYRAFGLSPVAWPVHPERRPKETAPARQVKKEETPVTTAAPPALSARWQSQLDRWSGGENLEQNPATELRNKLFDAICEWLDWDSMLMKPPPAGDNTKIYLPGTLYNRVTSTDAVAEACSEKDYKDPVLHGEFLRSVRAVLRYSDQKTWNYEGGEQDAGLYANLVDRLAVQATAYYTKRGTETRAEIVQPLAQALLIGARILNLPGATENTDTGNMAAIFQPAPPLDPPTGNPDDPWARLRTGAAQVRASLQKRLLRAVAAFQGTGDFAYAVDAPRLLDAIGGLRAQKWQLPADLDAQLFGDLAERQHIQELKLLARTVEKRRADIQKRRGRIVEAFGESPDVPALVEELHETAKLARRSGVFRPLTPDADALRRTAREMGPATATLHQAAKACQPVAEFGVVLSALAQIDEKTLFRLERMVEDYGRFLQQSLAHATEELRDAPPDPALAAQSLHKNFDELRELWNQAASIQP